MNSFKIARLRLSIRSKSVNLQCVHDDSYGPPVKTKRHVMKTSLFNFKFKMIGTLKMRVLAVDILQAKR